MKSNTMHLQQNKSEYNNKNNNKANNSSQVVGFFDIQDLNHYKKSAEEILGGYGNQSDNQILDNSKEIYLDDKLVGYISFEEYDEEDGTKLLGIGNFMILERGKGYGTQVLQHLINKYKNEYDLIYCFVDSDNEGAIKLYKKLGKVYDEDGPNDNGQYYVTFYDNGKYKLEENYDPPYNAQQIKDNYGIDLYNKLIKDPAHIWRMETGIELIHKEPTKEELERIWKNWQEMSEEQKEKSDKKSLELFGKTNEENYNSLIGLYESTQNISKELFFLSDKNMDGKTLEPRVPNNFLIKNGYEDSKSKRVCFAPSIDEALMAISQNLKGKKFFVHTPIDVDEKYVYQPSVKEVPDVKITGEIWYTAPVKLKTIGEINVIEDDGLPGHTYTYGKDNSAELYGWKWQWIDREELNESLTSIDDVETPEQLMDWMEENITYELANDEYGVEDDPPTKTVEEVIESGTGHCAEQSYLEYKVLDELGYFPQLIFVKENNSEDDYGADGSAHMFVVYQDDDDKYTYFEHSQEHNKGIHKFDSMSELLDFVGKNWWRYDTNSDILEVRYIDEPITGVNNWELAQECHKYEVDEVLDISNNVMEDDVPLDSKWDFNTQKIIIEELTTKLLHPNSPTEDNLFSIAFYDGDTLIGGCTLSDYNNYPHSFLSNFEIEEEYRGMGYGSKIIQYLIDNYDIRYLNVDSKNNVAINLYKKFGFKIESESSNYRMVREGLTESTTTTKVDIVSEIERVFKTQDNPVLGPSYILPNGKFLVIPEPKQMGVAGLFSYKCHSLIYMWLVSKKYVKGTIWDINDMHHLEDKGCIRVNLGDIPDEDALLNYIQLGKKKPNYDQQDAIIKWLDFAQQNNIKQVELQAGPWGTTKSYSFDEYLSDDILSRVMRYYSSGKLYENKHITKLHL